MKYLYRIQACLKELRIYHISIYSANAAFYIVLSVFPGIMLLVAALPYFGFRAEDLLETLDGLIPEVLSPLMERVVIDLQISSSGVLLSTTAIVAVWSSSRGIHCIQQGLNAIRGVRERRPYILSRLICMIYMILFLIALLITLVFHGFGRELATYFSKQGVPILRFVGLLLQLRGLILFVLLTALFVTMFCILPDKKQAVRGSLPGAATAAFSWLIFTQGYSVYVKYFGSYSVLYGSLSIIAMGMFWLYICVSILFYGCVLNLYLERRK